MPQAALLVLAPARPFDRFPITIDQRSSITSALVMLMLLGPALGILALLIGLLAALAAEPATALGIIAEKPFAGVQLALGVALWTALFVAPLKGLVQRFGIRRKVRISESAVAVAEIGLFGSKIWSARLSEFRGIAHVVRASLSGLRHELILVHRERGRCLVLYADDRLAQGVIDRAAALLRLPQIPPQDLYRWTPTRAGAATALHGPATAAAA
jgi:hypothetical protein